MRVHFLHRQVRDTVMILEEGNLPKPKCPRCEMLVSRKFLDGRHVTTDQCEKGEERKICLLAAEDMRESAARAFQDYGRPLEMVTLFKYLGRTMMALDKGWSVVVGNLQNAWKSWARLARIMGREGDIPRVTGFF